MKGFIILSVLILIATIIGGFIITKLSQLPPLPEIHLEYWGSGKEKSDNKEIRPFKIEIPESELKYLADKLTKTRSLTPPLEGVGFDYGTNTDYLNKFMKFWKDEYQWRERENYLNSLSQFVTQIGGLDIHFLHVKPDVAKTKGKKVIPLLMIHGWPGSPRDFYEIIPKLVNPNEKDDFVFEVIAPSIPGFGFSEAAKRPDLGPAQISAIFHELMTRLGHDKYFIHGGDWGSTIGYTMALLLPDRILGYHSSYCMVTTSAARIRMLLAYLFPSMFVEEGKREIYRPQFIDVYFLEFGFFHIQATKPDTVGVGLTDSPAGLAAYLLEKYSTWTNKSFRSLADGGLKAYNKIDLLDQIMIHWLTKSITTSMRLYSETANRKYQGYQIEKHTVNVPTACARMPNDLLYYPNFVLEGTYPKLVKISDLSSGGHFAAFEQPELLAEDIWDFYRKMTPKKT